MPKPKPTEIIRHELVLGRKEMELLENALVYPSVVASIKDLLPYVKDATTAIALVEGVATMLEMLGIKTPIPTPVDLARWYEETGAERVEEALDYVPLATGAGISAVSPLGGLIYTILNFGDIVAPLDVDVPDIDLSDLQGVNI
jgi:hypothetical protein